LSEWRGARLSETHTLRLYRFFFEPQGVTLLATGGEATVTALR
jgi:hypothetical protein